jgi:hypothetical protein
MNRRLALALAAGVLGFGAGAHAQAPRPPAQPEPPRPPVARPQPAGPAAPRLFIAVNGGYQVTSTEFTDTLRPVVYAEPARFDTQYEVETGPSFDVSGAVRVWRWLAVGAGAARFTRRTPVGVAGSVPHPFFFDRPRAFTGTAVGPRREELAVHVQARGVFDVAPRFQVALFGGPSYLQVRQGVVTAVAHAEAYPYDEASFGSAATTRSSDGAIGVHVGGDVAYFFTRRVGAGAVVQFSRARVELSGTGETRRVDAGGAQVGAGIRVRF